MILIIEERRVMKKERNETTAEFFDVKEIKRNLLFTKSGYIIGYLKLFPINISLLSNKELHSLSINITSKLKAEKEEFSIFIIPRSVDMDKYLNFLEEKVLDEMTSINKRILLNAMIRSTSAKIHSGQNFEHQFYIVLREKNGKENKLNERIREFEAYYNSVGHYSSRLNDAEILKLCNLFTNGITTLEEENTLYYESFTSIRY